MCIELIVVYCLVVFVVIFVAAAGVAIDVVVVVFPLCDRCFLIKVGWGDHAIRAPSPSLEAISRHPDTSRDSVVAELLAST